MEHPTQVMADLMTIMEKFSLDYNKRKVALVWVCNPYGIPAGIPHSLAIAGGRLGMKLTFAYPEGFDLDPEYVSTGRELAKQSGGSIEVVHDVSEAVKDADVVYAKGWEAIGKTPDEDLKMRSAFQDWYIRQEHFEYAAPGAIFMHAMPIDREREVTSEVADGPRSVIYDQAENRLHVVKAIMSLIM
jgi:ornithine carbamoyltransferase